MKYSSSSPIPPEESHWLVNEIARVGYGSLTVKVNEQKPLKTPKPKAKYSRKPDGKYRGVSKVPSPVSSVDPKTQRLLEDISTLPSGWWEVEIHLSDGQPTLWNITQTD